MTPERARRQMCWWIYAAVAIFAVRFAAYFTLDREQWLVLDTFLPNTAAWFGIALAVWRHGFLAGWAAGHRVADALTKDRP